MRPRGERQRLDARASGAGYAIEAARGFQRLVDQYGYTQEQVAAAVGKDRSTVANALRLLALPNEGKQLLAEGDLPEADVISMTGLELPRILGISVVVGERTAQA